MSRRRKSHSRHYSGGHKQPTDQPAQKSAYVSELAEKAVKLLSGQLAAVRENRTLLVSASTILASGVLVRLVFLDIPIRYDEAFTYNRLASTTVSHIISYYELPNNHLLHTLLVHFSSGIFGPWEWAIRLPAFIAGLLLLPLSYLLATRAGGKTAGLWSMAFVSGFSLMIEYSTNARGYTLMALFTALMLHRALVISASEGGRQRDWVIFCLAGVAGMFTVPVMLYPIAIVFIWLLAGTEENRWGPLGRRLAVLSAAGAVIVVLTATCYLPVILNSGFKALVANRFVNPLEFGELLGGLALLPRDLILLGGRHWPLVLVLPTVVLLVAGVLHYRRLALVTVVTLFALVCLQRVIPPERVFIFFLLIAGVLASLGAARLSEWAGERFGARLAPVLVFLPCVWAVAASASVYLHRGPERSIDCFPEGKKVADIILLNYGKHIIILSDELANETIAFYGSDYGRSWMGQPWDYKNPPDKAVAVVNLRRRGLEDFLWDKRKYLVYFNPPELLEAVDSAEVYRLEAIFVSEPDENCLLFRYLKRIEEAGEMDTGEVQYALCATDALFRIKYFEDAIKVLDKVLEVDSDNVVALQAASRIYLQNRSDYRSAEPFLQRLVEVDTAHVNGWNMLGVVNNRQGKHDEAEKCFLKAIELDDKMQQAYVNLGQVYALKGNYGEAVKMLRKAVELDPEDGQSHFNLGVILFNYFNRNEYSLQHFRQAHKLLPKRRKQIEEEILPDIQARIKAREKAAGAK